LVVTALYDVPTAGTSAQGLATALATLGRAGWQIARSNSNRAIPCRRSPDGRYYAQLAAPQALTPTAGHSASHGHPFVPALILAEGFMRGRVTLAARRDLPQVVVNVLRTDTTVCRRVPGRG
jgi:hypothetical protein